jgi:hypothetical protein
MKSGDISILEGLTREQVESVSDASHWKSKHIIFETGEVCLPIDFHIKWGTLCGRCYENAERLHKNQNLKYVNRFHYEDHALIDLRPKGVEYFEGEYRANNDEN